MAVNKQKLAKVLDFRGQQVGLDCVWGRKLEEKDWLKSLSIVDLGEISVPVSQKDVNRLKEISRQASFDDGIKTAVRREWQIDDSQISTAAHDDFLSIHIPQLVARASRQLGLDAEALEVEAQLQHLLIYPPGGFYKRCRNREGDKGLFATMLLQIPVEGGHEGSDLKIWLRRRAKSFDTSIDSHRHFHLHVFYDDCEHEMEPVTDGCRLVMVFHLSWKKSVEVSPSLLDHPISIQSLEGIKEALSPWQRQDVDKGIDLLAIPLEHMYSKERLSFANLKGKDRLTARFFQSFDFLELHLAILTKHVSGSPNLNHEDYRILCNVNTKQEIDHSVIAKEEAEHLDSDVPVDVSQPEAMNNRLDTSVEQPDPTSINGELREGDGFVRSRDIISTQRSLETVIETFGYLEYIQAHPDCLNFEVQKMIEASEPSYTTEHWIDAGNRHVRFSGLRIMPFINCGPSEISESELVGNEEDIFEPNRPDEESLALNGVRSAVLNFYYHRSVLVVWPRRRMFNILCRSGVDNALKHLERIVKLKNASDRQESMNNLHQLIWFCRSFPAEVWYVSKRWPKPPMEGQRTCRLLKLCIDLEAVEEGIQVLCLLGTRFEVEESYLHHEADEKYLYEGVRTNEVAAGIATLVALAGWSSTKESINNIVTSSYDLKPQQMSSCAVLSIQLLELQCTDAAFAVGNLISALLANVDLNILARISITALVSFTIMVIHLEGTRETSNPTRIWSISEKLGSLDVQFLPQLIVRLPQSAAAHIKKLTPCRCLYTVLCLNFVDKIDFSDETTLNMLGEIVKCYFWLGETNLLGSFVTKVCNASYSKVTEGTMLDGIMSYPQIWQMATTDTGKEALEKLIDARISELDRLQAPVLTWEQPNAVFKDYPEIEKFLRSTRPKMVYASFSSVVSARQFAKNYFGDSMMQNGYSASVQTGGKGGRAFCDIVKTRDIYDASMQKYYAYQKELKALRVRRVPPVRVSLPIVATISSFLQPPIVPANKRKKKTISQGMAKRSSKLAQLLQK